MVERRLGFRVCFYLHCSLYFLLRKCNAPFQRHNNCSRIRSIIYSSVSVSFFFFFFRFFNSIFSLLHRSRINQQIYHRKRARNKKKQLNEEIEKEKKIGRRKTFFRHSAPNNLSLCLSRSLAPLLIFFSLVFTNRNAHTSSRRRLFYKYTFCNFFFLYFTFL